MLTSSLPPICFILDKISFRSLSRFRFLVSWLCMSCQSFRHDSFRTSPIFVERIDVLPKSAAHLLLCQKTFALCSLHVFRISSTRHIASSSSYFLLRNSSSRSLSLFRSLSSFFRLWPRFRPLCRSQLLFSNSPCHTCSTLFSSLSQCINRFKFCRDFFPLTFRFYMLPGIVELFHPLLPEGCFHLFIVVPYHCLLFHFSLFSVLAFFSLALDSLFLLRCEHEDDKDTLRIFPELKEAAASDFNNHSSLVSSSSSSPSEDEVQYSLLSSILPCVYCVGPLPPMSTCTTSVCAHLQMVAQKRP